MDEDFDDTESSDQEWPGTAHDDGDDTVPDEAQYTSGENWPGQEWPGTEVKAASGEQWPGQEWPGTEQTGKPEAEGHVAADVREAAHGVIPAATGVLGAGAAGALAGTLGAGPIGTFVGGAAGMLAGAYLGNKADAAVSHVLGVDDEAQRQANREARPIETQVAGLVPFAGNPVATLGQRAAGGAMMGAFSGGQQLYEGKFDPTAIATDIAFGAAMPSGNAATRALHSVGAAGGEKVASFVPGRPDTQPRPGADVQKDDAEVSQSLSVAGNNALAQQPGAYPKAPIGQENSKAAGPEDYGKKKTYSADEVFGNSGNSGFSTGAAHTDPTFKATLSPEEPVKLGQTGLVEAAQAQQAAPSVPTPADPRVDEMRAIQAKGRAATPADRARYAEIQRPQVTLLPEEPNKAPVEPPPAPPSAEPEYTPQQQAERLANIESRKKPQATLLPEEPGQAAPETPPAEDARVSRMRAADMNKLADLYEKASQERREAMWPTIERQLPLVSKPDVSRRASDQARVVNKFGKEAHDKPTRERHDSAIDAVQKAYDLHEAPESETSEQLQTRLRAAVNTAHDVHGSNPLNPKKGYRPLSLDSHPTFKWFDTVQKAAARNPKYWTADKLAAFKAEEALARAGGTKSTDAMDAGIAKSRRSGDQAVENAANEKAVSPEDEIIAAMDAEKSGNNVEDAVMAAREGKPFDFETEEQEQASKPEVRQIRNRAELLAAEDPTKSLIAPLKEKPATKAKKSKYDFEGKTTSGKELDPETAARYLKMAEEAQSKATSRAAPRPTYVEGDKYSPFKVGIKDLTGKIADFGANEGGKLDIKKVGEDFKKLFDKFAKSPEEYGPKLPSYIAKRITTGAQQAGRNIADMLNRAGKVDNVIKVHALAGKAQAHVMADKPEMQRAMYDALRKQDPGSIKNATLRDVFEHSIIPAHFDTIAIRKWIRENHPEVDIGRDTEDMVHRRALNGGNAEQELESLGDNTDPTAGSSPISTTKRSPVMERQFVALEDAAGNRHIIHLELGPNGKPSGKFSVWKDYKNREIENAPPIDPKFQVNDIYAIGKKQFKMKDATEDEIHDNALGNDGKPMEYQRDAAASVYTANAYHRQLMNHLQTLDRIKASPEFKAYATTSNNEGIAKGWKPSETPGFERYWMDEHLRESLEDAYQQGFTDSNLNKVRNFSRAITQSIFWTPVAHIMNIEVHWATGRGWKWLPTTNNYRGLAETGSTAIKSVITHDKIQDILHENGAGLIYGGTRSENSTAKLALGLGETIQRNPTGWGPVADKMNMTVGELARGVYKASRHAMWSVNDMFLTQAVLERLRDNGKTVETASPAEIREAIAHIERHIPNYRTPSRIMSENDSGRTIAKFMRDPLAFGFGRYRYGMFNSYANMVNSVLHGDKAERIETAGQMLVMGAVAFAVYPYLYKPIAQMLTGNKEAEVRGRGPVAPIMHIKNDLFGRGDMVPLIKETISLSPLAASAIEFWNGQTFAQKPIVDKRDFYDMTHGSPTGAYNVAKQSVGWALGQRYAPVNTLNSALNNPNQGVAGGVRDAVLDLKNPSPKSQKYEAQTPSRLTRDHNQRNKSPPSILEKLLP